jgi:ferredoxin
MSRRELFGLLRPPSEPDPGTDEPSGAIAPADASEAPAAFSLDAFYGARNAAAPALPAFAVKAGATTPTTRVGLGRTAAAPGLALESQAAPIVPLHADLVPRVLDHHCLATRSFCSVCVERCPRDGAIVVAHGRPRIVPDRCDGCGHCIPACPAPILALEVVRRAAAPAPDPQEPR